MKQTSALTWGIYNNWQPAYVAKVTDPDFGEVLVEALNDWERKQAGIGAPEPQAL